MGSSWVRSLVTLAGAFFNSQNYLLKHVTMKHEKAQKNRKMIRMPDGKFKCRHCDQN